MRLRTYSGGTLLHSVCDNEDADLDVLRYLLAKSSRSDVNCRRVSQTTKSLLLGKITGSMVMLGFHRGNENSLIYHIASKGGATCLHHAVRRGDLDCVDSLLSAGADVMARDGYDYTPLHDAETSEAIEILLAAGADITAQGRNGFTPLHGAKTLGSGA